MSGNTISASGYFVVAEATFTLGTSNLTTDLQFENSDNVTHLLVSGFTGLVGDDLDTNDDGVLDSTPWVQELDRIAVVEEENPPSSTEYHYGPPTIGPDGGFVPGHVFRCEDGWHIGQHDQTAGDDTPGDVNACTPTPSVVWDYGSITVQNGTITGGTYIFPDGTFATVTGGSFTLDMKGNMSGNAVVSSDGQDITFLFPSGKLDKSKSKGFAVSMGTDGNLSLNSFFKEGGTFNQTDTAGTWYVYSTVTDMALGGAVYWTAGSVTVDAGGTVVGGTFAEPTGGTVSVIDGLLTLNPDGTINPAATYLVTDSDGNPSTTDDQDIVYYPSGKMDQGKTCGALVGATFDDVSANPMTDLPIRLSNAYLVKDDSSTLTTADLAGDWYLYSMTTLTQPTPMVIWDYGVIKVNGQGQITGGYYLFPDDSKATVTGGTLTIDGMGNFSGTATVDYLGNSSSFNMPFGRIDQSKTIGVHVSIGDDGSLSRVLVVKDVPSFPWPIFIPATTGIKQP